MTNFVVRRPVLVIIAWLAMVGAGFTVGVGVFERLVSDVGSVPGSESDRAWVLMDDAAPAPPRFTAVVHGRPATDPAVRSAVDAAIADVRAMPGVVEVTEPVPSATTGRALLFTVAVQPGEGAEDSAQAAAQRLRRIASERSSEAGDAVSIAGATVTAAGGPLTGDEFGGQAQRDVQRAELLSTPVVLVLLLLIFGGLLAAGLPLLIAIVGTGGTFGILYAFSHTSDVSVYAIQVATMLSVGLGVDYALLMVNRFREERAADPAVPGAIARTVATAGRTVLFSGLTVAVALAGLTVFPDPFLRSMGLAGVAVVVVNMLAALTLLPALLALVGRRIKPRAPRPAGEGVFARVARGVQRRPLLTALATGSAMVVIALPVVDMRLSQGDARLLPSAAPTRMLYDALAVHYPQRAASDPIVVVAAAAPDTPQLAEFRARLASLPGVTAVETSTPGAGRATVLRATTARADADRTVTAIRGLDPPFDVAVTGGAAMLVDYRAMLAERLPWAIGFVALGTLALLFLFTGSVVLPVKALLTNLLSIGAALGAVVWVFQQGHLASWFGTVPLDGTHLTIPLIVGAIAFGISVDYEVFLLSRIRERWLAGADPQRAVAEGLQHTGRVVTSAALLLVVVFGAFLSAGFVPIKAIGLGLVLAVALDATVVRMLLVPATMTLLGRYNWWAPRPLRRLSDRATVREPAPVPSLR